MDVGTYSISSEKSHMAVAAAPRPPLQEAGSCPYMLSLSTGWRNPSAKCYGDRFIPDRSAMDMDVAQYLLTEPRKDKENAAAAASPSKETYRRLLAEKLLNNRMQILAFRNKPPEPENVLAIAAASSHHAKPAKQRPHIPQSAERDRFARLLAAKIIKKDMEKAKRTLGKIKKNTRHSSKKRFTESWIVMDISLPIKIHLLCCYLYN